MIYNIVNIGGTDYKLRLTAAKMIEVEKAIGTNPINAVVKGATTNEIPRMGDMLTIFWGTLTHYQHGITKEQAYALYDRYIEDGHTYEEFVTDIIMGAFKSAGYIVDETPEDEEAAEDNTKND